MSLSIPARVRSAVPTVMAAPPAVKAGPTGPGAGPLMTEYLLPRMMGDNPQKRIAQALKLGREVDWVMAAERAIAAKLAGCDWRIEDPDGESIDLEYKGSPLAVDAYKLMMNPQGELPLTGPDGIGKRMSRRQWLTITSRHMGLAGSGAWYTDQIDLNGLPHAILYIRPDRLTPKLAKDSDVLMFWALDERPGFPGTKLELDRLHLLQLTPPDFGVFGIGLMEAALNKAINNGLVDKHFTALLSSGGRISGVLAPKEGAITDDNVYEQMIRDWRNVVEQPESARRLQVVRAPVEFIQTVMGVGEMQIIDLMYHNRDALLALWGVPLSQLGGTSSTGLNSGESRKYDEAALWQAAVHDRLEEVRETQQAILDLWEPVLGWAPCICFDEPEFDDDTPNFEKAQLAQGMPMRNSERRKLLGLEPFDDPELDNQVWMPVQVVAMAQAPDEEGNFPKQTGRSMLKMVDNSQAVPQEPGQMATATPATKPEGAAPGAAPGAAKLTAVKASDVSLGLRTLPSARRLRDTMEDRVVPATAAAVSEALSDQADAIAAAVERNWAAISRHGGSDETQWWRDGEGVGKVLKPLQAGVAEQVSGFVDELFS